MVANDRVLHSKATMLGYHLAFFSLVVRLHQGNLLPQHRFPPRPVAARDPKSNLAQRAYTKGTIPPWYRFLCKIVATRDSGGFVDQGRSGDPPISKRLLQPIRGAVFEFSTGLLRSTTHLSRKPIFFFFACYTF